MSASSEQIEKIWPGWKVESYLNEGQFGKVYKAVREENGIVTTSAIKVISIPKDDTEIGQLRYEGFNDKEIKEYFSEDVHKVVREIELMLTMQGTSNVVNISDFKFLEKSDGIGWDIFIQMEYLESFTDYISDKSLSEDEVIKLGLDILGALKLCFESDPKIIHRDIKPANILMSPKGFFKLGDFGISRQLEKQASSMSVGAGSYNYTAPEVIKSGEYNTTADIYSLGIVLYRLLNNNYLPFISDKKSLAYERAIQKRLAGEQIPAPARASEQMARIILKACAFKPSDRYQSPDEFIAALEQLRNPKKFTGKKRKGSFRIAVAAAIIIAASGLGYGAYFYYSREKAAELFVSPEVLVISLRQSSPISAEKHMPDGEIVPLNDSEIRWETEQNNIIRVDGGRVQGINYGKTVLTGFYRNKQTETAVRVVEPMNGIIDISQRYLAGNFVSLYAGTQERESVDGALDTADFISPESIDIADDGTVYLVDSAKVRRISCSTVESVEFEPAFLTPNILRCYKDDVYILTDSWEDIKGVYYGLIRLANDSAEGLYMADAKNTAVEDFGFGEDGLLYFIERNEAESSVSLKTININTPDDIQVLCELPTGMSSLTVAEDNSVYMTNMSSGMVYLYKEGSLENFAGNKNERAFIDGTVPRFFMPQKIKYADGFLYIWDFNVLRRIEVNGGIAGECITLAGIASPEFEMELDLSSPIAAEDIIFANGVLTDFAVDGGNFLVTDPKRGVVWKLG